MQERLDIRSMIHDGDIEKAMNGIDLSKQDHIMSPKLEAVVLSNKFSKAFTIE